MRAKELGPVASLLKSLLSEPSRNSGLNLPFSSRENRPELQKIRSETRGRDFGNSLWPKWFPRSNRIPFLMKIDKGKELPQVERPNDPCSVRKEGLETAQMI